MENRILSPDHNRIWEDSEKYFMKICGFDQNPGGREEEIEEAFSLREECEDRLKLHVILSIYEEEQRCTYGMCIPELADIQHLDMLEQFYIDAWMTAILDAGRDWLKEYIAEYVKRDLYQNKEEEIYVSDAFGPGFYGMGMEKIQDIFEEIEVGQIGISMYHGSMRPPKSNVGYYIFSKDEILMASRDCGHCLSGRKNCLFCKNYTF